MRISLTLTNDNNDDKELSFFLFLFLNFPRKIESPLGTSSVVY